MEVATVARKNPFKRIRLVYQRSSLLTKCVVLAAVVVCTVALLSLRIALDHTRAREEELRKQAAALEQANKDLQNDIDKVDTIDGMKDVAQNELGLVDPNTVIFIPEN